MKNKIGYGAIASVLVLAVGCAGLGTFKRLPKDQQIALFQDIQNNYRDYRGHQCPGIVIFEPKNDQRSIQLSGEGCDTIDPLTGPPDLEKYEQGVFQSLMGKNGQLYGYIQWNNMRLIVGAREKDGTSLHVWYNKREFGGPSK